MGISPDVAHCTLAEALWHRRFPVVATACLLMLNCFGASGCLAGSLSPIQRLHHHAHDLNESVRWGQAATVASHVAPAYVAEFLAQHIGWGSELQLAEGGVRSIRVDPSGIRARVKVDFAWYRLSDMRLRRTSLEQTWQREGSSFVLVEQVFGAGDRGLLQVSEAATKDRPAAGATGASREGPGVVALSAPGQDGAQ